jgi:hypothetical protein
MIIVGPPPLLCVRLTGGARVSAPLPCLGIVGPASWAEPRAGPRACRAEPRAGPISQAGPAQLGLGNGFCFIYFTDLMLDSKIHISWLVAPNDMVQVVLCSMWGLVYYKNIICAMFCDELNSYYLSLLFLKKKEKMISLCVKLQIAWNFYSELLISWIAYG